MVDGWVDGWWIGCGWVKGGCGMDGVWVVDGMVDGLWVGGGWVVDGWWMGVDG